MNAEYSKVNWPMLKQFKKACNKIKNIRMTEIAYYREYEKLNLDPDTSNFAVHEILLSSLVCQNKIKNYFIDSKFLIDFFKKTKIKKETILVLNGYIDDNFTYEEPDREIKLKHNVTFEEKIYTGIKYLSGCIFSKELNRSVFFNLQKITNADTILLYVIDGEDVSFTTLIENGFVKTINDGLLYYLTMACNLIFYMSAFPENILDRPPDEVIDKLNKDNSKTITLSKDIENYLHETRDVSPHLRRGHFKYLSSERYVNKRGQTIFVRPTFVKGEAKTVIGE